MIRTLSASAKDWENKSLNFSWKSYKLWKCPQRKNYNRYLTKNETYDFK